MSLPGYFNAVFNSSNMLLVAKTVTIASMGISTGAGLSYTAMIMPALRKFSSLSAVSVFCETAFPAMTIQVSAIVASVLGGSYVYYKTKNKCFLYGPLLMASVLPYTVVMFFPLNKALFEMYHSGVDDGTIVGKMILWRTRQFGRIFLNLAAFLMSLYGGLGGCGGEGDENSFKRKVE